MSKEKLLEKIHIKWLSKAKTAIINGDEMTVLPYGYLTQACSEAIDQTGEETIRAILEEMKHNPETDSEESKTWIAGFNNCRNQILNKLKKVIWQIN